MKLGIITDEVTQEIDRAVDFALRHKLDGVELRSLDDQNIDEIPISRVKEIKEILDYNGLEVCNLSSSFFKCSIDSSKEYDDNIEKLKRLTERAHILNCSSIRGFAFFTNGCFEKRMDEIIGKFQRPIEMLASERLYLLLEADPSVFTSNCKKLSKLITAINSDCVKAIYDPGNDIYDPDCERPYPEGFNSIKDYIKHVHIKDALKRDGKPESVKVGTGEVPYESIFKGLSDIGYDGYVVLETHYRPHAEIPEELLKRPGGRLFSYNGEVSSEECIKELKRIAAPYLR
jgi:Sugar phosphate isomerases/epimerases